MSPNKTKDWRRSESRVVRPFVDARDLVSHCAIRVGKEGDFTVDDVIPPDRIDRDNLSLAIKFHIPTESVKDVTGVPPENLRLNVIVNEPGIKRSETVLDLPLDDIPGEPWEISEEHTERFSWKGAVDIHVVLLLTRDMPFVVGNPFQKGHWLAKKTFRLIKKQEGFVFPVKSMKSEDFERMNLPGDTTYYVDFFSEDLNIPYDDLDKAIQIYIHEDAYRPLAYAETSSSAKLAMSILFSEIVACILVTSLRALDGATPEKDTVIGNFADKIVRRTKCDFETLRKFAGEPGCVKLKAVVQSFSDLNRWFKACDFYGGS